MVYEIISTESLNVLGSYENETAAQNAARACLTTGGARDDQIVVQIFEDGHLTREIVDHAIAVWARVPAHA